MKKRGEGEKSGARPGKKRGRRCARERTGKDARNGWKFCNPPQHMGHAQPFWRGEKCGAISGPVKDWTTRQNQRIWTRIERRRYWTIGQKVGQRAPSTTGPDRSSIAQTGGWRANRRWNGLPQYGRGQRTMNGQRERKAIDPVLMRLPCGPTSSAKAWPGLTLPARAPG